MTSKKLGTAEIVLTASLETMSCESPLLHATDGCSSNNRFPTTLAATSTDNINLCSFFFPFSSHSCIPTLVLCITTLFSCHAVPPLSPSKMEFMFILHTHSVHIFWPAYILTRSDLHRYSGPQNFQRRIFLSTPTLHLAYLSWSLHGWGSISITSHELNVLLFWWKSR